MPQTALPKRKVRSAVSQLPSKPPTRQQRWLNALGWLVFVVAIVVSVAGSYGLFQVMRHASTAQLDIVGTQNAVQQRQVWQQVAPVMVGNYFTADLEQIRDRALAVSWVDRVVVSRAWPNQIRVRVMPKHAIARWGSGRLLSDNGEVFQAAESGHYAQLPILHGPQGQAKVMMRRYHEINQLFGPAKMQLKALYLTERMTWFMQFDNRVRVIVDQDQTMHKLQRLSLLVQRDLKPVWPRVVAADLRYRNGLALQWYNAQPPNIAHSQFVVNTVPQSVVSTPSNAP